MSSRKRMGGPVSESGGRTVPNTKASTKAQTVKKVAAGAKTDTEPVSVRIHKLDGNMHEERTYPRSADPRTNSV
jgi:hypothetical protein